MNEIKALNRLREALADCIVKAGYKESFDTYWITTEAADKLLDEIESEIKKFYMPLPLDSDGIPIRVGDRLECHANGYDGKFNVYAVGKDSVIGDHEIAWIMRNPDKWFHVAEFCTHFQLVKPRTLEDVLRAYACDFADSSGPEYDGEITERYAEEIRELMEG